MKHIVFVLATIVLSLAVGCEVSKNLPTDEIWTDLFRKEGDSWQIQGKASWEIKDGELKGKVIEGTGFAVSTAEFDDFHLRAEFFPDAEVNSGIFFRCNPDSIGPVHCYEANIWDNHINQEWRTGAVVLHAPPLTRVSTVGRWNSYEIKAERDRIRMWVNNRKTMDLRDDKLSRGVIALQVSGEGSIRFRDVKIRDFGR